MKRLLTLLFLLVPVWAGASYTIPIVASVETLSDGRLHLVVVFTGDKGEPAQKVEFFVDSEGDLKTQVKMTLDKLNGRVSTLPKYGVGTVIDVSSPTTPPPSPPPQTLKQMWWSALSQFYAVDLAVRAGVVPPDDPNYLMLKSALLKDFVSTYVLDSGWPR